MSHPARGIALMTAAMLSIPIADGIAKHLTAGYQPLFLGWASYAASALIVLPVAALRHRRALLPAGGRRWHGLRTAFLVTAMSFYFLAIARIPLATAVSTYFVGPIIAVGLSAVLLGERLTWRKGISLALGFAGSLVILRPGGEISPGMLLALASGVMFGFYLIASRKAAGHGEPLQALAFQYLVGTALLTPQAIATWTTPQPADLLLIGAMGLVSAVSHMMSIAAFRLAEASTLSPLVYLELLGATVIGYAAFHEIPDGMTMAGAGCIVLAGLILLRRRA